MDVKVFDRIRGSLLEKRQNLADWLQTTPVHKRQISLGPADEHEVLEHLHVIDTSLEKTADKTLGLCEVCHDYVGTALMELDYSCCVCIDHLSSEEMRQLETELELSQTVQRAMLPHHPPEIPGLEMAVFSRPAQIVGGDYFDFFQFHDGAHALAIADVAGHGLSASMLMASILTVLRTMIPENDSPAKVLNHVNHFISHNIRYTTFVTLFLGRFDPAMLTMTYCNAGHNPPLFYHKNKNGDHSVVWLRPTGAAIGLVEDFEISVGSVALVPGDILLLYTDGVTEAINSNQEEFGQERLSTFVQQGADLSPQDLVRKLWSGLLEFTQDQPLDDDTTIIACKISD